ncbi:Nif3-like dinuclear metal center hexameric protein [Streptococcus porcinus]
MKVRDVIKKYEAFCPPELSMTGDVFGLQVGSFEQEIDKVMVTLDIREQTVQEAISANVGLIITKHAPIFKGLKDLVASPQRNILLDLVKHDIAVYVSHTNIDVVPGGLNDWFCQLLDIYDRDYLSETQEGYGIGRIGNVDPIHLEDLALKVKEVFALDAVRLIRYNQDNPLIKRVAICGGSGDDFYQDAIKKHADLYITGDIYYHTAQEMLTEGLLALDPGHHIEVLFIEKIVEKLTEWQLDENWPLKILASQVSTNPFSHL